MHADLFYVCQGYPDDEFHRTFLHALPSAEARPLDEVKVERAVARRRELGNLSGEVPSKGDWTSSWPVEPMLRSHAEVPCIGEPIGEPWGGNLVSIGIITGVGDTSPTTVRRFLEVLSIGASRHLKRLVLIYGVVSCGQLEGDVDALGVALSSRVEKGCETLKSLEMDVWSGVELPDLSPVLLKSTACHQLEELILCPRMELYKLQAMRMTVARLGQVCQLQYGCPRPKHSTSAPWPDTSSPLMSPWPWGARK